VVRMVASFDCRWSRASHLGDFTIPGLVFLYIAGFIGWSGAFLSASSQKLTGAALKAKKSSMFLLALEIAWSSGLLCTNGSSARIPVR